MTIRILLVDDHELVRTGLRLRLQREDDFEVVADAADAASAYALTSAHAPDLVVMDIDLPGEDGLTATKTIKERWPHTRVLALTGRNPLEVVRGVLQAGADGLVLKNETSDELVRAIQTISAGKAFLSPDAATALVSCLRQTETPVTTEPCSDPGLSARERSVLKGLADGLSYKEVAAEMGVSVKTVDTYRARLGKKLGCANRAELVRCAVRLRLVRA